MSDLIQISGDDCLIDVDESAYLRLVELRGGCRCHLSPPCGPCSEQATEEELNEIGYTMKGGAA